MDEITLGLWHWTAVRERIGSEVSSYYLESERVIIDPMIPPEGLGSFDSDGAPEHAVLTNRHHDRDAWRLHEAFGRTIHCVRNGLHELAGRGPLEPFDSGDELQFVPDFLMDDPDRTKERLREAYRRLLELDFDLGGRGFAALRSCPGRPGSRSYCSW